MRQDADMAELELVLRKMGHAPRPVTRPMIWLGRGVDQDGYVCRLCGATRYGGEVDEDDIAPCLFEERVGAV